MGIFESRRVKSLRSQVEHLADKVASLQNELDEAHKNYENAEMVMESNNETYKRLQKRIKAQQTIIDAYKAKYGDIRPNQNKNDHGRKKEAE